MNRKQAQILASIANDLVLASYGFNFLDSGDYERIALRIRDVDPKVKEWIHWDAEVVRDTNEEEADLIEEKLLGK